LRRSFGILSPAVAAHRSDLRMLPHPLSRGFRTAVWEQIYRAVALQVDKDGSEPLTAQIRKKRLFLIGEPSRELEVAGP
jgi:hypothetical protein